MRRRGKRSGDDEPACGRPWLRVGGGSLLLAGALASVAFSAGLWADWWAYQRAPFCEAAEDGCVRDTTGRVTGNRDRAAKWDWYAEVDVAVDGRTVTVDVPEGYGLLDPGSGVTVRLWRDEVVLLGAEGERVRTREHPHVDAVEMTVLSWVALVWGGYGVASGVPMARAGGWRRAPTLAPRTRPHRVAYVAFGSWGPPMLLQTAFDVYEVPVLLLTGGAGALVARRLLAGHARDAATPLPSAG